MRIKRFNESVEIPEELDFILNIARDEDIEVVCEMSTNFYATRRTGNIIFSIQDTATETNISEEELNHKLRIIGNVIERVSDIYQTEDPFIKFIDFGSFSQRIQTKLLKDLTVINKKNYKICSVLVYVEEISVDLEDFGR